mmetsp:Transcript_16870/g.65898  ORF Transcript_16870/g.65898 Transcript_16870/m.65898 type:complete len:281 (+) Transcript_16870:137-979(+)|eukprot:CAMPEP_0114617516 /NCGR_PEP_ID=MMETSP0168-20121206/7237_1 /TAXON_ID=95228 ORGANISM="Vannella sp., Strain DIVA3 517/6/12" /NCGR_SAMPLE_ID=MMETSP0168 /ASSEMBLY_ACC=CAM_ASM_000044 /LENGTH=280 /DNA_ID=CAMNT_0001828653 /DNA_START=85 /DNA_END=927 /DNA_ORIENTATION=-
MSSKTNAKVLTTLTPEQTRACEVTSASLVLLDQLTVLKVPKQLMRSDFRAFCYEPISREHLYHESSWIWNQSSGKRMIQLTPDVVITGCKYNARLKPSCAGQVLPKYKAWIFEVSRGAMPPVWFLWCEKGYEGPVMTPSHSSCNLDASSSFWQTSSSATTTKRALSMSDTGSSAAAYASPPARRIPSSTRDFSPTRAGAGGLEVSSPIQRNRATNKANRAAIVFPNAPQFGTSMIPLRRNPLSTSMPPDILMSTTIGHQKLEEISTDQIDALMSEWVEHL